MIAVRLELIHDELMAQDHRTAQPRIKITTTTTLRDQELTPFNVMIHDFSPHGFRFTSDKVFEEGARVRVGLRGAGSEEARIVWRKGRMHGCSFERQISRERMAAAFRASNVVAGRIVGERPAAEVVETPYRWPRRVQLGVALGGAILAWAGLLQLIGWLVL